MNTAEPRPFGRGSVFILCVNRVSFFLFDILDKISYNNHGDDMEVRYSKDALKFLARLDKKSVERIRLAIQGLTQSPPEGDIKPMQGYSDNRKRLRVGGWRVIFKYGTDGKLEILFIIDIGNRGDIYK